jgi:hypothetical protein
MHDFFREVFIRNDEQLAFRRIAGASKLPSRKVFMDFTVAKYFPFASDNNIESF